jgi:carboxypeptidase family protein
VDLANVGIKDPNNPWLEVFGEWKGTAGSAKNASPYDTQIAFSAQTLHDFFNIDVDANGLITHIEAPAASVFLHDDALADAIDTWSPDDNPFIGLHIDNFQSEQLSLYLAGRDPKDSGVGVTDPRTSPMGVMHDSGTLQYQTSKSFMWVIYQKFQNHDAYKALFEKVEALYGVTLEITSSQGTEQIPIFGVKEGDTFKCRLTPGFVIGGTYVSGEVSMFNLLTALVSANETGHGTWTASGVDVNFTLTNSGASVTEKVFTVDKTPGNVGATYPSIFHYAAAMSPFGMVDYTADPQQFNPANLIDMSDKEAWGIEDRSIDAGLGYVRLTNIQTVSGTQTITEGGRYNYQDLENGGTLTLTGSDTFVIVGQGSAADGPKITSSGYPNPANNNQNVSAGQVIDISDFFDKEILKNNTDILNSSFYGWTEGGEQRMARVTDSTVPTGTNMQLYIVPAAKDLGAAGPQAVIDNMGTSFWHADSPYYHSARLLVANLDVMGVATTADAWAEHFLTELVSGTGVIDASLATGKVLIVVDDTIKTAKLGSGCTTALALAGNTGEKTFVLNPNATTNPTIDLRSGDLIDQSELVSGLAWAGGTATTFDNKVTATTSPYLRYSYYAGWTGTEGSQEEAAFQALVSANGNTGTDDPVKIVENALDPLRVTINRTSTQTDQTSASLMNFTVVFSEEVSDFDESDLTLGGTTATVDGASIVVTNPSGDQITYTVAVTLEDTASTGNVISTIIAGAVHDEDGFSNLDSTSVHNSVTYVPNTITGQGNSNITAGNLGGEPLPGVHVSLSSSAPGFIERTTTTDSDGHYQFENVPDGTYQVTITTPNACIDSGSDTTVVNAEGSQTYEADFSMGALKSSYIPNRMMVTTSLPVGSTQWHQVVQEALDLGNESGNQGTQLNVAVMSQSEETQYLVLGPQTASLVSDTPIAEEAVAPVVNDTQEPTDVEPEVIAQTAVVPSLVPDTPIAEAAVVAIVNDTNEEVDTEPEVITQTAVVPSLVSETPLAEETVATVVNDTQEEANIEPEVISQTAVVPIVQEAIERWASAGLDQEALDKMHGTTFELSDLAGWSLGMARGNTVWLDWNAAGRGWFVDSTPDDDEEFGLSVTGGPLQAIDPQVLDQIDLLSVVLHELGHIAGLEDSDDSDLMGPSLEMGLRLIPSTHDAALARI